MSRVDHHEPKKNSGFDISYHMEMVSDVERVGQIRAAIDMYADSEHVFCELGCGSGIFSIYAAKHFKHVYAVDIDKDLLTIARENAKRLGVSDKITFVEGNALDYYLPEGVKADVVFSETMSIWLATEPQVPIMNHAVRHLGHKSTRYIPCKVHNLMEIAYIDYQFGDIELKGPLPEFTGIKSPRVYSESQLIHTAHLNEINDLSVDVRKVEFNALVSGFINCARLFCIVEFAQGVNFHSTDSLMPVTIVPLTETIEVTEGKSISLDIKYNYHQPLRCMNISSSSFS